MSIAVLFYNSPGSEDGWILKWVFTVLFPFFCSGLHFTPLFKNLQCFSVKHCPPPGLQCLCSGSCFLPHVFPTWKSFLSCLLCCVVLAMSAQFVTVPATGWASWGQGPHSIPVYHQHFAQCLVHNRWLKNGFKMNKWSNVTPGLVI